MKATSFFIFTLISYSLLALPTSIFSAPGLTGIAINSQTKECAEYWIGDEFTQFTLDPGWEAFYSQPDGSIRKYDTPYGTCEISSTKDCCSKLNLRYIENKT